MADEPKTNTGGAATGTVSAGGIMIDKNKSAEKYLKEAENKYIVPRLVREKFPDLIKLIYETESMNDEEREYWLQIMPIMSEEQIIKFRDILVNEKEQLERLDREYEKEISKIGKKEIREIDEEKIRKRMNEIEKAEKAHDEVEKSEEEALLKKLENI
ncbi:hypothetical protein GF366_04215 [Candidatus Peregrinibacteria bacterium]|nr:hypothetical protein [Candidatus Peregrinibacteria bacterium]